MSTTPIVEQIAQKVRQRLGVTEGVSNVVRPTRLGGFRPEDMQLHFVQGEKTKNVTLTCPGNPPAIAWNQPFMVRGELLASKEDRRPIDQLRNSFEADIQKALTTGTVGDWCQWDGLALYSEISNATPYTDSETTITGFEVTLLVIYRTLENDPYTQR